MLRDVIRRMVRRFGLQSSSAVLRLRRFYPRPSDSAQLAKMLAHHRVNVVLDVGANAGQFGKELRLAGYTERIVSFEPLSAAHAQLLTTAKGDPNWTVVERMAIGNQEADVTINISADSVSSSVMDMLEAHISAAPDSVFVAKEQVRMHRLDNVTRSFLRDDDVVFLKIDVQGFESQVLEGAAQFLPHVAGMQLELSLVPCYEGQDLLPPMLDRLTAGGFDVWSMSPGTVDQHTGRMLQVDAVLFRAPADRTTARNTVRPSTAEVSL
jgi:FkbM family methyltransferase